MICSTSPAKIKTVSFATRIKKVIFLGLIKENRVSPEVILLKIEFALILSGTGHFLKEKCANIYFYYM